MENRIEAARALAARGFKIFPVKEGAKQPPLWKGWPEKAAAEVPDNWPADANIGIHCAGMIVIDVDSHKGGDESFAFLEMVHDFPATFTVRTPSGGRHHYYRSARPVPNSVSALGAGIDIRSEAGYVVGPGSSTPAGYYRVEVEAPIADAPDWLVLKLGTIVPKLGTTAKVEDAVDEVVARAADWLKTAERSVKGAGGDQAAFRVACGLRDRGVSYQQACELMRSEAWDYGCGWRGGWLEDKPIRSAYKYASGEPGSKAALPDDFPVVEVSTPKPRKVGSLKLSEFANTDSRTAGYAVKGLFQRRSYAEAFGAPGEGKTFVMLDIAYHVAAGKPWMDRKVHAGPVLYLAYEGTGGLVKRAQALRQHYGHEDVPLFICGAAFNLRAPEGRQELGRILAELPAKPVMIVIDTFARALMGGDENSAQDVSAFNQAIQALIDSTGACVVLVHHTGKDKSKGARGSSALNAALDTEVQIDDGRVTATKQRDMEAGEPIGFKLVPVMVGVDEDGDDVTSCVVEPASVLGKGKAKVTGNAKRGFDVLCALRPTNKPITAAEWREGCVEFLGARNINQRFFDMKKVLLAKGYVVVDDNEMLTRRLE